MKAMILAAGRGERMRPLTDENPKPLLLVRNKPIIVHLIETLKQNGIREIVINTSHLAEKIQSNLGNGQTWNVTITYSHEPQALETGGGIVEALPLLGDEPFLVVSGDIWTDYPFAKLSEAINRQSAHLIMVPNPNFHPKGDYGLQDNYLTLDTEPKFTYASMGILHPKLFVGRKATHFRLSELFVPAIQAKQISGEIYSGGWKNVGTIQELQELNEM